MLFSARDIRAFYRGRTDYEIALMDAFGSINEMMRLAALREKTGIDVTVHLKEEYAAQMSREICQRLSTSGFCTTVKPMVKSDIPNCLAMPVRIDWV